MNYTKYYSLSFNLFQNVLAHQEDQALLKAYIAEWRKFFTQCNYLPMPFGQLELTLEGKNTTIRTKAQNDESVVRKVCIYFIANI